MNLKIRNRILSIFSIFSIFFIVAIGAFFIYTAISKAIIPPPTEIRNPSFLNFFSITSYSFSATIIAITSLLIYVPLASFGLVRFFGKTQSSELIFFIGFLVGILCEIFRLFIITDGTWLTYSPVLITIGRIILFGRTLTILSFLFAALMSQSNQRQYVIKNLMIMFSISILIAIFTPFNTSRITSTGMISASFSVMYNIFRILMAVLTICSFVYNGIKQDKKVFNNLTISFIVIFLSYSILLNADCFLMLIFIPALLFGTVKYLISIHNLYLW